MKSQQKNVSGMGSSRKASSKILGVITRAEAERLLLDWANLPGIRGFSYGYLSLDTVTRMRTRYPALFGTLNDIDANSFLSIVRDLLRKAWDAHDQRHRDWYLFKARDSFQTLPLAAEHYAEREQAERLTKLGELAERIEAPPAVTPFEAAIFYFQTTIGDRAKHCGGPDCVAPYFIAVKRWQKYCSEICAGPANRESKRKWWREHHQGFE